MQLGRKAEALDSLDRVKNAQGLVWLPFMRDSPCFKRLAAEPRYVALIEHLEDARADAYASACPPHCSSTALPTFGHDAHMTAALPAAAGE